MFLGLGFLGLRFKFKGFAVSGWRVAGLGFPVWVSGLWLLGSYFIVTSAIL